MEVNFLGSNPVHFSLSLSEQLKGAQRDLFRPVGHIRAGNQFANLRPMPSMRVPVLRVFMIAVMIMLAVMMMLMVMFVIMILAVPGLFRQHAVLEHIHLGCPNSTAIHRVNLQFSPNPQSHSRFLQKLRGHARVNQRAQKHVSRNSREALNLADFHMVICRGPAVS
jgi:competence protein ComGC